MIDLDVLDDAPACRVCGCSAFEPCEGGCIWVEPDLCSRCIGAEADDDDEELKGRP